MLLRVTSRVGEAASAPAYQACTTVCSRPKAVSAITSPSTVSPVRRRARKALRMTSRRKNTRSVSERAGVGELPLVEVDQVVRRLGGARIVGDHYDRLAQFDVQPVKQ